MPIREVHMSPGTWTVPLVQNAPYDVLASLAPYGCIVITPTHIRADTITAANLITLARYTGPLRKLTGEYGTTLEGAGNAIWLGDEDGKGVVYKAASFKATSTLTDHVTTRVLGSGRGNGITAGTILTGSSKVVKINPGDTPRVVLDKLADLYDVEWRINPGWTLDVNTQATLYPTNTTPTLVVRRDIGGRDLNIVGLAANLDSTVDAEDYTTAVYMNFDADHWEFGRTYSSGDVVTDNDGQYYSCALGHSNQIPPNATYWTAIDPYGTSTVTSPYYAPDGTRVEFERYETSRFATTQAQADTIAARRAGRWSTVTTRVDIDTDQYDVRGDLQLGDTIYVYDPNLALVDYTREVYYRGQAIHPKRIRVTDMEWPVENGMGVYFRGSDSANTVIDLTDWVDWEEPGTRIGVGALHKKPTGQTKGYPQP